MPSLHKVIEADDVPLSKFFEQTLPTVFQNLGSFAKNVRGTYSIKITGEGGGHWFLDPSNGVVRADSSAADTYLEMSRKNFIELIKGTLDASAVVASGDLKFKGDPDALSTLGALLGG